jgi:uncharacterized oligopeptide transporter (OPT) family protein
MGFAIANNSTIEEPYKSIFQNISGQSSALEGIGGGLKDEGLVKNIYKAGAAIVTGSINVFVTGLEAMGKFFELVPVFGNILSAISLGIPWMSGLIILLTLVVGIYIAMRYIQSVSNKPDLP